MVASLNGIVFDQVYGDNTGDVEVDTDGDGTATQEDEFVSLTNTSLTAVDISGWQIWSDMTGSGAPDAPQDGLYHTFPPGTVLQPGETLYIINEITGPAPDWAQEASEGGVESGPDGTNTNFLTEGANNQKESVALVDPVSGDFIVFNMDDDPSAFSEFDGGGTGSNAALASFPGTNLVAEENVSGVRKDQDAGQSYQYDPTSDSYVYAATFVPCFLAGTLIETEHGPRRVERLAPGDRVVTRDRGLQPIACLLHRTVSLGTRGDPHNRPVLFEVDAFAPGRPSRPLAFSPQHRVAVRVPDLGERLAPAKAFLDLRRVRVMRGLRTAHYIHLVLPEHHLVSAHGLWVESFYPGAWSRRRMPMRHRLLLDRLNLCPGGVSPAPARPHLAVGTARRAISAPEPVRALD